MEKVLKLVWVVVLGTVFVSCQSSANVTQILSKEDTRKEIMDSIAHNSSMAKEMMQSMATGDSGMAMMQDHQKMMMQNPGTMMKLMKDNPGMMKGMMSAMMETAKADTTMMAGMCKMMMDDPQMNEMMKKMNGNSMDMKMQGPDKKMHQ